MSQQQFNPKTGRAWGGAYSAPPNPAQPKAPPISAQLDPGVLVGEARAGLGHESTVSDEEFSRSAKLAAVRALQLRAHLAKNDPSVFSAYVLRDERNGQPIHQAPLHRAWHELLSSHPRLLMWSHVEGGKTTQVAVGRTLWELGRDPSLRVCVVSNTTELAMKITRQIAQYIERSPELRHVFPHLKPTDDPALPWKAKALTIARTGMGSKDPSIQATGVHGNVLGSRIDLLILDDVLDYENTSTPGPREDVWRWVKSTLMSRLTEGARVWIIGNAWHPDDLMHRMEREPGFVAKRFPVLDTQGVCTWPERWSPERIRQARADLGPLEYARQLLCQARDDTSARFKREWVEGCLAVGQGKPWCETAEALADSLGLHVEGAESAEALWRLGGFPGQVIHGVDLAVQKHDAADKTVIFSILVHEDGLRQVLSIRSGRWAGPEIIAQVEDTFERLGGTFVVENNAAQNYIVQFLQAGSAIPIMPFTTGRNKAHPEFGVEGLAAELAACKWLLPNEGGKMHDELSGWVQELLYYDPREHTGDRVMASWLAREGARRLGGTSNRKGGVSVRIF